MQSEYFFYVICLNTFLQDLYDAIYHSSNRAKLSLHKSVFAFLHVSCNVEFIIFFGVIIGLLLPVQ